MKLLDVSGPFTHAALEFEQICSKDEYPSLWEKARKAEDNMITIEKTINEHPTKLHIEAYEFGDVDKKFIEYVKNEIQDYDHSKHHNFFVVE